MSIKSKLVNIVMGAAFIAGQKLMSWLEAPEVKEQTAAERKRKLKESYRAAQERKRKRKETFRAAQSDAFKAKHPIIDCRQPEFTVDNGNRRRYTDIHD